MKEVIKRYVSAILVWVSLLMPLQIRSHFFWWLFNLKKLFVNNE